MRNGMGVGLLIAISLGCAAGAPPAVPSGSAAGAFLAATPPTFSFGNVPVGTATTRDVVLSNTGTADALITDVTVTGTGFSATGLPVPLTLGPGTRRTLTVGFAPPAVGSFSGNVTLASDAADVVVIAPTGTGVTSGPPPGLTGTGASYAPTYITATGGGSMPNWATGVVTAPCAGDGVTDDTACLRGAAESAHSQNKPLVIPYTPAFYKVSGRITIYTSVGGVGGMPTIKTTSTSGDGSGTILVLAPGMNGWVYNLHLAGTFDGANASGGEWSHNVDIGSVNGVTIKGNLLENAMGDALATDISQFDGGGGASQNVIVDSNTIRNPYRCGVALVKNQKNWVISNNIIDKQVNYVSGIDFEPEAGTVTNVEVTYNKFVMNNRAVNPTRSADGEAVSGWMVPTSPNPGGNYYLHHNYGTFGTGFAGFGGNFGYILQSSNAEGTSPPP
jgi:hypothetical protein